ncbi:MAG: glucose 1-dehydrogenase [Oscillospiraceae bacterium]|jgi:3-oxoacyl-[acyl-carrier protein] reductase|nr:glucose 1-dehydrogenase [Oscillospiraceae bacterium]
MKRVVLVTGASRGIGYAIARRFCEAGDNVVINFNKTREPALELARAFPNSSLAVRADVSRFDQVKAMVGLAQKSFGSIDVVVNNAGIALWQPFTEADEAKFDELFSVNVKGVFNVCKATVPQMIKRKTGKIINISSVWGLVGASCEVLYSASKAAVIGFSKALAKELGPSNITVNCVVPGIIETDMNNDITREAANELKQSVPLARFGKTSDVAGVVLFLASAGANYITGQVLGVDGGFMIT